ncbi:hypothetical protein GWI33_001671 [Rhynchophorus ferrugineus]|uniref:Uncharacterized protein n=1 Tax=Rhynchophorus ferrugineus TaxID=354439 RepID=A0A834ML78_RHYFE|nr:hypothetical protein GWI33_001671 [Rhynchophorus ferrugineus]
MALVMQRKANVRLPPEINRILYIRNLPYKITAEEMYDIFVLYYQANKAFKKTDIDKKQEEIDKMKSKYGINT